MYLKFNRLSLKYKRVDIIFDIFVIKNGITNV